MRQHKNIENPQITKQNVVFSLCPSVCLLWLALPSPSSMAEFFQFLKTVLREITQNFKRHERSFLPYIVPFPALKIVSLLNKMVSLLIVRLLALKTVVTITSIYVISYLHVFKNLSHLYKFQISNFKSSQIFLFYKFFCTNLSPLLQVPTGGVP